MAVPKVRLPAAPAEARARQVRFPDAVDLVSRFPLAAVILRPDGSVEFANARARRDIAPGWFAGKTAQLTELAAHGHPGAVLLATPRGASRRAMAHAASVGDRIVVVFDSPYRGRDSADVVALHRRILELERSAMTDRLTGLWNRRHFDLMVAREISFSERELSPVSLALFDIDHFKRINDTHGHAVGDDVLRVVATRLRAGSRPTDLLFRWGGEEFALLTPATSAGAARSVAERLRGRIALGDLPLAGAVTVSAGVAEHEVGESAEAWFARADAALYASKQGGRNRVSVAPGGASTLWHPQRADSALRLVWSEQLVSGHALIDEQHRALFIAANALMAALTDEKVGSSELTEELDCVLSAVARHFADEEAVLAQARYPDLPAHRQLHRRLLEAAQTLRGNLQAGHGSAGEIVEFLAYEVVNRHILRADRLYFPYVAPKTGP